MLQTPSSSNAEIQKETSGDKLFEASSSDIDVSILENNDNQSVENWVDILDFQFNSCESIIKLDVPDYAEDNPLHIFGKCYELKK